MTKTKIALIVGSADPDSLNLRLGRALILAAPDNFEIQLVPIVDLPFYQPAYDQDAPASGTNVREMVSHADGVIFVTPEYNRAIPGVLKNAIDWISRPPGKSALRQKPTMIAGASPGSSGTATAQSELRSILPVLGGIVKGQPELYLSLTKADFDEAGAATTPGTQKFLETAMANFGKFVNKINDTNGS